jgi:hypothetical protein
MYNLERQESAIEKRENRLTTNMAPAIELALSVESSFCFEMPEPAWKVTQTTRKGGSRNDG